MVSSGKNELQENTNSVKFNRPMKNSVRSKYPNLRNYSKLGNKTGFEKRWKSLAEKTQVSLRKRKNRSSTK